MNGLWRRKRKITLMKTGIMFLLYPLEKNPILEFDNHCTLGINDLMANSDEEDSASAPAPAPAPISRGNRIRVQPHVSNGSVPSSVRYIFICGCTYFTLMQNFALYFV